MKNRYTFNAIEENLRATKADIDNNRRMTRTWQLCWKCQKDKPLKGASIKFFGTVRRFICMDCVEAKLAAIRAREQA